MALGWYDTIRHNDKRSWTCGYCGKSVPGIDGYRYEDKLYKSIYICPYCENPSVFIQDVSEEIQVPSPIGGQSLNHLPDKIETLYNQIRRAVQYTAYIPATLGLRTLLMYIAVDKGAQKNKSFIDYINYLDNQNYIPPGCKEWIDLIRTAGNEATHTIQLVSQSQAESLLSFTEMLLTIVYEYPAIAKEAKHHV